MYIDVSNSSNIKTSYFQIRNYHEASQEVRFERESQND